MSKTNASSHVWGAPASATRWHRRLTTPAGRYTYALPSILSERVVGENTSDRKTNASSHVWGAPASATRWHRRLTTPAGRYTYALPSILSERVVGENTSAALIGRKAPGQGEMRSGCVARPGGAAALAPAAGIAMLAAGENRACAMSSQRRTAPRTMHTAAAAEVSPAASIAI